jgi:WS/DGAT/MGAT family acyltransferase
MATRGFDPALPLWEAVLVEGAEGASGALVIKVHHSLIDGVGGLTVLAHLFDAAGGTRTAPRLEPVPEAIGGRSPLPRLGDLPDAVRLVDDAMDAVFHPLRSVGRLAAVGASVARLMAPTSRPISPIMTGRSFRRHADVFDLDLETVKQAARAWGGTVNDVFVASVVRGLALYHEQHRVVSEGFRTLMPVSVRAPCDPTGGNRFVPARFVISTHADAADSVAEVKRVAEEWKNAPGLAMSEVLAAGLSALPAAVARSLWGSMLLGNDVCVTNIPGPPSAVTVAGAAVQGIYAVSPPSGAALSVSLISVANRLCVTITADVAAIPDSPKLTGCIEDGFAEVCSVRSSGRPQVQ